MTAASPAAWLDRLIQLGIFVMLAVLVFVALGIRSDLHKPQVNIVVPVERPPWSAEEPWFAGSYD